MFTLIILFRSCQDYNWIFRSKITVSSSCLLNLLLPVTVINMKNRIVLQNIIVSKRYRHVSWRSKSTLRVQYIKLRNSNWLNTRNVECTLLFSAVEIKGYSTCTENRREWYLSDWSARDIKILGRNRKRR